MEYMNELKIERLKIGIGYLSINRLKMALSRSLKTVLGIESNVKLKGMFVNG
ncbi:hypothetical protein AWH56_004440 [Anaerobacillus isosaccharinicus]|uniref:Uncharacterized protein n=1 Tax=Anaerobacillus isosaccharinicus TaxID=1532552 RepID=A0A7S7RCC6_9BACI|nr:hypothetical protein [Anaerobacillus isosaccharinicus]MBA5584727.1 hypothetical protein [Anaerobacillus isosaccharinicus]QOY36904.1 hypothetical protein AWH56_004440 [Anaerobacillus isosaccharinicus]